MFPLLLVLTFLFCWPLVSTLKERFSFTCVAGHGCIEDLAETAVVTAVAAYATLVFVSHVGWMSYRPVPVLAAWAAAVALFTWLARARWQAVPAAVRAARSRQDLSRTNRLQGWWTALRARLSTPLDKAVVARFDPMVIVAAFIGVFFVALLLRVAWTAHIAAPFAWDDVSYHFTSPRAWVNAGRLGARGFNPSDPYAYSDYYPANMGLLHGWSMLLGDGHQWAQVGQIVLWVSASLSLWLAARVSGLSRAVSVLPVGAFMTLPVLAPQLATSYVDVAAGSLLVLTLFGVLAVCRSAQLRHVPGVVGWYVFTFVAAGLTIGVKANTLAVTAVALAITSLVVLVSLWRHLHRPPARRVMAAMSLLSSAAVAVLVLGGFWYVRNLINHGNPVYPFTMDLGVVTFKGPFPADAVKWQAHRPPMYSQMSEFSTMAHNWVHDVLHPGVRLVQYDERLGAWGVLWPVLFLSLVVFTFGGLVALVRHRRQLASRAWVPLVVVSGVALVGLAVLPANWWSRYAIGYVAVAALPFAWFVERVTGWWRWPLAACLFLALAVGMGPSLLLGQRVVPAYASTAGDPQDLQTQGFYQWTYDLRPGTKLWVELDGSTPDWPYMFYGRDGDSLEPVAVNAARIKQLAHPGSSNRPDVVVVQDDGPGAVAAARLETRGVLELVTESTDSCGQDSTSTCWLVYRVTGN
jgi:hypothetical protein